MLQNVTIHPNFLLPWWKQKVIHTSANKEPSTLANLSFFPETKIFSWSRKFSWTKDISTRKIFSLINDVSYKQILYYDAWKFSTRKIFSHKQIFYLQTIFKIWGRKVLTLNSCFLFSLIKEKYFLLEKCLIQGKIFSCIWNSSLILEKH